MNGRDLNERVASSTEVYRRPSSSLLLLVAIGTVVGAVVALVAMWPVTTNSQAITRFGQIISPLLLLSTAAAAFYFGARSVQVARTERPSRATTISLVPSRDQLAYTDLFAQAIGQLSSERVESRIGGIYLLELVGAASSGLGRVAREVLAAFARTTSNPNSHAEHEDVVDRSDIQAAIIVLGRLRSADQPLDLREVDLRGLNLEGLDFTGVNLGAAKLQGASLNGSALTGANLASADLSNCTAVDVDFSNAVLQNADLSRSNLAASDFQGALLTGARLDSAFAVQANFAGALLADASLRDTDLRDAVIDSATMLPDGFEPHSTGAIWERAPK